VKNDASGSTGLRIKQVRLQAGLNQVEFAERLGLGGPTVVSKYEKDQREPEIAVLKNIAKMGRRSLDWLLTGKAAPAQKNVDKKLGKLTAQLERIYEEGDSKKISGIQVLLDMADPQKSPKKRSKK